MTAQHDFTRMLRDEIAPRLREVGLKGSGQKYRLPDPDVYRLLGFQKDKWSTAEEVGFTVNLSVIDRADWERYREDWMPDVPGPTESWVVGRQERLGMLMPDPHDRWWRLRSGEPTSSLAAEVVAAIVDHGLPELRR